MSLVKDFVFKGEGEALGLLLGESQVVIMKQISLFINKHYVTPRYQWLDPIHTEC